MSVFVKMAGRRGLEKRGPDKVCLEKGNREQRAKNCFLTEVWMAMPCVAMLVIAGVP